MFSEAHAVSDYLSLMQRVRVCQRLLRVSIASLFRPKFYQVQMIRPI